MSLVVASDRAGWTVGSRSYVKQSETEDDISSWMAISCLIVPSNALGNWPLSTDCRSWHFNNPTSNPTIVLPIWSIVL